MISNENFQSIDPVDTKKKALRGNRSKAETPPPRSRIVSIATSCSMSCTCVTDVGNGDFYIGTRSMFLALAICHGNLSDLKWLAQIYRYLLRHKHNRENPGGGGSLPTPCSSLVTDSQSATSNSPARCPAIVVTVTDGDR